MTGERVQDSSKSIARKRPNFSTRTAEEDVSRLAPGDLADQPLHVNNERSTDSSRPYEPLNSSSQPSHGHRSLSCNFLGRLSRWWDKQGNAEELDNNGGGFFPHVLLPTGSLGGFSLDKKDRHGHKTHQVDDSDKLGTFSGVFVPTTLNVLSILMFLRFGFILGQGGVLGIMGK